MGGLNPRFECISKLLILDFLDVLIRFNECLLGRNCYRYSSIRTLENSLRTVETSRARTSAKSWPKSWVLWWLSWFYCSMVSILFLHVYFENFSLTKNFLSRPKYKELLSHPFLQRARMDNTFDMGEFISSVLRHV